ncbi:hypothetical protein RHGRI_020837 [Rhododendron griersonianum]|uniref:DUF4283 domain-containing protein n=1 Tax=Rhododendron griersonianum TaxID=479676 RepID=A0AAV6JMC6_9ERIC|nr:hypothetical protein RHGRI_020837 [Rhododendron griersonianum]
MVIVAGESVVVPIEYQVLPPKCDTCHVFGHHTSKCASKPSSSSSPPQPTVQAVIVPNVEEDDHKVDCASKPSSPAAYSTKEELSVSEDQLLVILGGVESSNQDEGELKQHIKSITSLGKDQFEPDYSLAPEPPDQLGSGSKEVADLVSKGSTGFNEYLSKSAKKRLKKQAKEESMEGIKSRPHAKNN